MEWFAHLLVQKVVGLILTFMMILCLALLSDGSDVFAWSHPSMFESHEPLVSFYWMPMFGLFLYHVSCVMSGGLIVDGAT